MDSRAALIVALVAAAAVADCGEGSAADGRSPAAGPAAAPPATPASPSVVSPTAPATDSARTPGDSAIIAADWDDAPGSDGSDPADSADAPGSGRALVLPRDTLPTLLRDDSASGPWIVGTGAERRLHLPPRLLDVLHAQQPGFETMRRADLAPDSRDGFPGADESRIAPFAVIADFDGDRRPDVAMLGRDREHRRIVVILDRAAGPRVHAMAEDYGAEPDSLGVHQYLGLNGPGDTFFEDEAGHHIHLRNAAVLVESEGASEIWYYVNGRFLHAAIGD